MAWGWPEGGLRARPEGRSSRRLVAVRTCAASPPVNVTALVRPHRRVVGPHFPGFGVALVEPWGGFGGALVWLCTPESMPSICLQYGLGVALWWLWVACSPSWFKVRGSRFNVRRSASGRNLKHRKAACRPSAVNLAYITRPGRGWSGP